MAIIISIISILGIYKSILGIYKSILTDFPSGSALITPYTLTVASVERRRASYD